MIRIPDIPGLPATKVDMPQINPRAAMAPAAALGQAAQAIAGVGDHFFDSAVRVQKLENARLASQAKTQLYTSYAEHRMAMEREQEPAKRIQATRDFLANYRNSLDTPEMSPAVRAEVLDNFETFAGHAMVRAGEDATRLSARRTEEAFKNEYRAAKENRDREGARKAVSNFSESGYPTPEETKGLEMNVDYEFTYDEWQDIIAEDPLGAEKATRAEAFMTAPGLTEEARATLRAQAGHAANVERAEFLNDWIISGKSATEDELLALRDSGHIDSATHARILTNMREAKNFPHDAQVYGEAYTQIQEYIPDKDTTRAGQAKLRTWLIGLPLPQEDIKVLNDILNERINPNAAGKPKSQIETAFAGLIREQFEAGQWGKFEFDVDDDNDPDTKDVKVRNQAEYEKAWKLREQFAEEWRVELGKMPADVKFEEAYPAYQKLQEKFKNRIPPPTVNISGRKPLAYDPEKIRAASSTAGTFGDQKIMPAGVPYRNAGVSVFGGPNDPADSGTNARGQRTGAGGVEGAAVPEAIVEKLFPGKTEDKDWVAQNVRAVVTTADGAIHTLGWADFGTSEETWKENKRPVLDLTPGAVQQLGGRVTMDEQGNQTGVVGLDTVDFAVVSIDTGGKALSDMTWPQAKAAWYASPVNKGLTVQKLRYSLAALMTAWYEEQGSVLPPRGSVTPTKRR